MSPGAQSNTDEGMNSAVITPEEREKLSQLRLGMLGFGAQGSAEAQNLARSGVNFQLGLRSKGPSFETALKEGLKPISIEKCIQDSRVLLMNLPDQAQAEVYRELIHESEVEYLVFAHGFNTHFGLIPVKAGKAKHVLIAPKGAASGLAQLYGKAQALPAILAFRSSEGTQPNPEEQDWIEILARAMGCHPQGLIWANFKDETVCDLFSEQVLLCGGISSLLRRSFEVLVEAGYNPETAYFETLYELKLIVDLLWTEGITGMRAKISPTARYGDITRGDRVFDDELKRKMREVLNEIERGEFAREFLEKLNSSDFLQLSQKQAAHPLEQIGRQLRERLRFSDTQA